jgi:hypothetical protein
VIGGLGSISGAIMGTVYVIGVPLLPGLRDIDNIDLLSSGLGLLLLLYFLPGGLAEGFYRLRDNWLRKIASRRGIHVPSLLADSLVVVEATEDEEHIIEAAEQHVVEGPATVTVDLIGCPVCGARLPVHEAGLHEHFAVADDDEPAALVSGPTR